MNFEHSAVIAAPKARVWEFVMDVPRVSQCVPGVQDVKLLDGDNYEGTLKVRVGPIALTLAGKITMEERDASAGRASMVANANDRKVGGGVQARMAMLVEELAPSESRLTIRTDANVLGKLGEFGQPVIRKKAEQMMADFTENVKKTITAAP
ncbi:MAG TPA: SRPBCC family protein [Chloroflexota bacterium]|nr:SRPBCC family protein [Chloroflexota bacterium]